MGEGRGKRRNIIYALPGTREVVVSMILKDSSKVIVFINYISIYLCIYIYKKYWCGHIR